MPFWIPKNQNYQNRRDEECIILQNTCTGMTVIQEKKEETERNKNNNDNNNNNNKNSLAPHQVEISDAAVEIGLSSEELLYRCK